METRNAGLTAVPLFVAATRPPMRWGVTYAALLFNLVFTMEVFLLTRNLLTLLLSIPIHGLCMLLCARDARYFDLIVLWGRVRLPALLGNLRYWQAGSYSPLEIDLPDARGRLRLRLRCMPAQVMSGRIVDWDAASSCGPIRRRAGEGAPSC
ncbi:type IV secretory pathway VirB3 family protein [Steroidobacter denitrificans]|uniref:Type IV secretory pathway VirB3 family protein n=1 Tax=Steroidobacter denitrificans TaxID=465721 RepID=A0A127FCQ0_STEDE|nr:VirB3 family type IV secretion system protein [Steroidobacter denitrificans]AMN47401.1 type IV secretory pathway VirB3 family protein [Steroidobacter denitrificans]